MQTRVCHSGPLASGDRYPLSCPDQFSPGKRTTLGPVYSGYHHGLWTAGYYLFSRLSPLKPSKGSRSQDLGLLNVKEIKGKSRMVNLLPKCLQFRVKEKESEVVPFHRVHPGDRLCRAIPPYLTVTPSAWQQGTLAPEMPSWLLLLTSRLLVQSRTLPSLPRSWVSENALCCLSALLQRWWIAADSPLQGSQTNQEELCKALTLIKARGGYPPSCVCH